MATELFPAFLKLNDRPVLLVGGGQVALSKLRALEGAGARITVVAPALRDEFRAARARIFERAFEPRDLDGQWLCVAAAPGAVNREVAAAAEERRIFVNAVDDVASASAYLGGVVRKSWVTLAVSTEGRAPALAGLLREGLEALLPDELDEWLGLAERLRRRWREEQVPMSERRPLLLRALQELYAPRAPLSDPAVQSEAALAAGVTK